LDGVINDAIAVIDLSLKQRNGTIVFTGCSSFTVLGDHVLLVNVITTIIDNAIKYNVQIPCIEITCEHIGDNIEIAIEDNGIGISPAYYRKIFEPFFRIPTGNRHETKGHGLGLSFAAQAISLHGGSIWVESNADEGSTFTITIPAA
jgi:two-component system phosphate regulon sensor histidine kinase PhoR